VLWLDNTFGNRSLGYVVQAGLRGMLRRTLPRFGEDQAGHPSVDELTTTNGILLGFFTVARQADMNEGCGSPDERGLVHQNELVRRAPGSCLNTSAVSEMPFRLTVVLCRFATVECVPADGEASKGRSGKRS